MHFRVYDLNNVQCLTVVYDLMLKKNSRKTVTEAILSECERN